MSEAHTQEKPKPEIVASALVAMLGGKAVNINIDNRGVVSVSFTRSLEDTNYSADGQLKQSVSCGVVDGKYVTEIKMSVEALNAFGSAFNQLVQQQQQRQQQQPAPKSVN